MIKYRYNLETDPEPGPHVRRIRAWSPEFGAGRFADTWTRVPVARGYLNWRVRLQPSDRRRARRLGKFFVGAGGIRQHRPAKVMWVNTRRGHNEFWTDGNKVRSWGILRGATLAVDADAMRRLHTKKRRGWR